MAAIGNDGVATRTPSDDGRLWTLEPDAVPHMEARNDAPPMTAPDSLRLSVLHLEDDVHDAALIQETLEVGGLSCTVTRVETEPAFVAALERGGHDLILADYTLPSFDGVRALKLVRETLPHIPFIFVSGTLDEDLAIRALRIGATDYVIKTRLARLAPAVQRA